MTQKTPREIILEVWRRGYAWTGNSEEDFKKLQDNALSQLEEYYVPSVEKIFKVVVRETIEKGWYPSSDNLCNELAQAIHNLIKRGV